MTTLGELLAELIAQLENAGFCSDIRIVETSPFSAHQFACKIRATIFSTLTLQIRIYYNQAHCDYSYQVFVDEPLCRWDNAEHYPELTNFPHHHHTVTGAVVASALTGYSPTDLTLVLEAVRILFANMTPSA